jgi:hypothetical protein
MPTRSEKRTRRVARYETVDPALAAALVLDGVPLLNTERRGDDVLFTFRARRGLARRLREIRRVSRQAERVGLMIKARIEAALATSV